MDDGWWRDWQRNYHIKTKRRNYLEQKKGILTGERPTSRLHIGHYVGSLENRVRLQDRNAVIDCTACKKQLTEV
jgi:hypothetical protein